jgi:thymidylate kinase
MIIICLSGPKGSGKSTYSDEILEAITVKGLKAFTVKADRISFSYGVRWCMRKLRGAREADKTLYRIDVAGMRDDKRDDAGVRASPMKSIQRIFSYLLNAIIFRTYATVMSTAYDVMICDRYSYDYLVRMMRPEGLCARMIHAVYPTPSVAMYLEVDAVVGQARRQGSTKNYYDSMNYAYRQLAAIYTDLLIVGHSDNDETRRRKTVMSHVASALDRQVSRSRL